MQNFGRILLIGLLIVALVVMVKELVTIIYDITSNIYAKGSEIVSNAYTEIYVIMGLLIVSIFLVIFFLSKPVKRLFP